MNHSTRLLSWGQDVLSTRVRGGFEIEPRETLTQREIESIARETRFFIPPIEAMQLPSFADLAARCQEACTCSAPQGLRRRQRQQPSQTESVCSLLGAMVDRFGGEPSFLSLLERLLLETTTSPCVRRAAASALGSDDNAREVRRRALGQLKRRAEWEGRNEAQADLIARLS